VEEIKPDVVISAAYKWLLGPYSLSLAYYGPRFEEGTPLEETWTARKGSRDFENLTSYTDEYAPGAARYDVAERANFLLAPIAQRSMELLLDWRPGRIQDYCRSLTGGFLSRIGAMGYVIEDEAFRAGHLFGVRIPHALDRAALRDTLRQRRVQVSVRGSSLRVSPNIYNRGSDLDPLEEVLLEAVR
jgi:selenocysteine lyase/cysteine desulfurase